MRLPMETRGFDSLLGRTVTLSRLAGDAPGAAPDAERGGSGHSDGGDRPAAEPTESYRFVFDSIFGPSAVLKPLDLRSGVFARAAEAKTVMMLEASIDGGKAVVEVTVERWSERTGALRVYRPKEVTLEQRRKAPRLVARLPLELGVVRDGEMRILKTFTEDISVGGFAAVVDEQLFADEVLVVLLRLPRRPVLATAEVTLIERMRRRTVHAKITAIGPDDAVALAATLHEIEAETAARAGGSR